MKCTVQLLFAALTLTTLLFVRLGRASAAEFLETGGAGANSSEIMLTGVIDAMDGATWIISGQTVSVDPALVAAGTFVIGDTIKVEALLQPDGSLNAKSVELPSQEDDRLDPNQPAGDDQSGQNPNPEIGDDQGGQNPSAEVGDDQGDKGSGTDDSNSSNSPAPETADDHGGDRSSHEQPSDTEDHSNDSHHD
jgi:hypothetical protein